MCHFSINAYTVKPCLPKQLKLISACMDLQGKKVYTRGDSEVIQYIGTELRSVNSFSGTISLFKMTFIMSNNLSEGF